MYVRTMIIMRMLLTTYMLNSSADKAEILVMQHVPTFSSTGLLARFTQFLWHLLN